MNLPQILIASSESGKATGLAKDLGSKFLGENENVKYYSWDIDNKYYTAQVMICTSERLQLEIPIDGIEAVVLHFNPKAKETQDLNSFLPLIHSLTEADELLLACEEFPNANKRDEVTEWCHVHKFELVDMVASESSEVIDDNMEIEKYGYERIVEVLHTHTWPNRILKGLPNSRISSSNEPDVSQVGNQLENMRLDLPRDDSGHTLADNVLDGIMGDENADFGELFSQLMTMKQYASTLSPSNRRAAAEQLVIAFCRTMGGDPSEFEDLDE